MCRGTGDLTKECRRLVAILAGLISLASSCNAILGIESHPLASPGDGGLDGAVGVKPGDRGVDGGMGVDAPPGATCGFTMPNPVGTGLPNPASYTRISEGIADGVTKLIWES